MNKYYIIYYFYKDLFNFFYYPCDYYLENIPLFKINDIECLGEKIEDNENIYFGLEC